MEPLETLDILIPLGENTENKLEVLNDKFWVWETMEESIRPHVDKMTNDQVLQVIKAFGANYKGSNLFWDYLFERTHKIAAKLA